MRTLTLSVNDLTLIIPDCRITEIEPFIPINFPGIGYTVQGVATVRGTQHEPRYIWNLTALLKEGEMNKLRGLFVYSDAQRRQFQFPGITLIDKIQQLVEPSPRTRMIAPGTSETQMPGELVSYYGVFQVFLVDLKTPKDGGFYNCTMTLTEIEKVAA